MTEIPKTMQAMVLTGHGGLEMYEWHEDWPTPVAGDDEVLIKVEACGLNNTDVNTRSGWYSKAVSEATTGGAYTDVNNEDPTWGGAPLTFPRIQGADVVGRVVAVGANGDQSIVGKRVMTDGWLRDWDDPLNLDKTGYFGSECDGGYAQYTKAHRKNVGVVDSPLTSAELATFSCSYSTAEGMLSRAKVVAGDTVLIPGASGGVGGALIQLANRRGARTIAMASVEKHSEVAELKPDLLLPRSTDGFADALKDERVTVVADVVGGDGFPALIDVLARGGRYTCSGAIAGPMVELDLRTFYLRDLTFTGSTVLPLNVFGDLLSYIEKGEIKPALAATYPLKDYRDAQAAFIAKKHSGNIVVTV
jgi:NADPH:quinone reductase-like Zn-dependent oxidoreductase